MKMFQFAFFLGTIVVVPTAFCADVCPFIHSFADQSQREPGVQVGFVVFTDDNKFSTFVAQADGSGPAILDVMNSISQKLQLVLTKKSLGTAVCRMLGVPPLPPPSKSGMPPEVPFDFCHTKDKMAYYWSFYLLKPGSSEWTYADWGIDKQIVGDGDIVGWVWTGNWKDANGKYHPTRVMPPVNNCR